VTPAALEELTAFLCRAADTRPWQRAAFNIARRLRGCVPPDHNNPSWLRVFRPLLCLLHQALTDSGAAVEFDDLADEFAAAWSKIKFPAGGDVLKDVREQLDSEPPPPDADLYVAAATRRLLSACAILQRLAGQQPFFLSCRVAADLADLERVTAARRLRLFVADGVLNRVEEGTAVRAARYEYPAIQAGLPDEPEPF